MKDQRVFNALCLMKVLGACLVVTSHYSQGFFAAQFYSYGTGCFLFVTGYYAFIWENRRGMDLFIRKVIRLYPAFLIAAFIYLYLRKPDHALWPELIIQHMSTLILAPNEIVFTLNPAFWSMPLFFFLFAFMAWGPRIKPGFIMLGALIGWYLLTLGNGWHYIFGDYQVMSFPVHFYVFCLGGTVGMLLHKKPVQTDQRYNLPCILLLVLIVILGKYHVAITNVIGTFGLLMMLVYSLFFWCLMQSSFVIKKIRPLAFLGKIGFGIYLFHNLAMVELIAMTGIRGVAGALVALVLTLIMASAAYWLIELPLNRLYLRYYEKRQARQKTKSGQISVEPVFARSSV